MNDAEGFGKAAEAPERDDCGQQICIELTW